MLEKVWYNMGTAQRTRNGAVAGPSAAKKGLSCTGLEVETFSRWGTATGPSTVQGSFLYSREVKRELYRNV